MEIPIEQASRHAVYTNRFGGYVANLFDPYVERLKAEIKVILSGVESTQNMRKINSLVNEIRNAQLSIYGEYNEKDLLKELQDFADLESNWQGKSLSSLINTADYNVVVSPYNQVWAAVTTNPLVFPDSHGVKLLEPFIKDIEAKEIKRVGDIVRTGFITGRTSDQIVRDITKSGGILDKLTRKNIKAMVRTSTNHTSTVAMQKTMRDNDDVVIGYEIVATLDGRTSSICRSLDGTIFKWGDKKAIAPPFHINCRTTTAPAIDARFKLDGIGTTRASKGIEGGQQVSADLSYYDWLKEQSGQGPKGRAFVMDVLGKERGRLFMDGGLSTDRFKRLTTDQLFQPITLDELRKKESLQLAFDNID